MAEQDDDWEKFLKATEEDDEEVETGNEPEDEPQGSDDDSDEQDPDKSKEDEDKDDPKEGDDSDEDDDPDKGKGDDDADTNPKGDDPADDYKPRLKQFLNEDGSYNIKKAEDAYVESGKHAVELKNKFEELGGQYDQLLGAIKAKPKVAEELFGKEGAQKLANDSSISSKKDGGGDPEMKHPLLQHLDAKMKNTSKREYNEFVELHPEAVTDPEKARKIGIFLKTHGATYREENDGEIPSMKESLEAAYRYYGWDLEIKNKEDVATAAKKAAATRRTPGGGKKKAKKNEVEKGEEFFARKLGVKLK